MTTFSPGTMEVSPRRLPGVKIRLEQAGPERVQIFVTDVYVSDANKSVNSAEIARRLGVSPMTVLSWRHGTPNRTPLPTSTKKIGQVRRVHIYETDLLEWLTLNRPDLVTKWCARGTRYDHR